MYMLNKIFLDKNDCDLLHTHITLRVLTTYIDIQSGPKNSLSSQFLAHKVHDKAPDVDYGHPLKSGEVSLPVSSFGEPAESVQGL